MRVALSENAQKQYIKLPTFIKTRIDNKINSLEQNPYSGKKLSGEFKNFWSIRAWPYRIIYEINETERRIEVHKIAHRQGAYR